ncbi:methylmalonyl-CoA mutase family protein [Chloroflexota bacterium]
MEESKSSHKNVYSPEFWERFQSKITEWEEGVVKERLAPEKIKPYPLTHSGGLDKETKKEFTSGSGDFAIKRVYTPLDIKDTDPIEDIGLPAQYPYTRSRDPVGYRAFRWPLGFYAGYGSGESANQRFRELYAAGAREIGLALDLPTQIGLDSDYPLAEGEVGKVGVAIDTVADLEGAMEGIPLTGLYTGTTGNCIGPWMLAMFYVLCEKRGVDPHKVMVTLQNDPFKEYTGRGTFIFNPAVAVDLASDVVEYIFNYLPEWRSQIYCTTPIRWGGCSASQEIGFGIANLMCYVEAARDKGVMPEDYIPRANLHMSSDSDLFEEAAKFRAARRLWAKIARERVKTDDPRVLAVRLTVFTAANRLTAQEPLNNTIRTTAQVLAAILGGVDHIHVPAHDEALALPTFESTRLANLTKHVLHDECFVGTTVDPLGGSYYVESLTNQLEEKARHWYDQVEARGGAKLAVERGYYFKEMAEGQYRYQKEVESGERQVIGVNKFVLDEKIPIKIFKGDPEGEQKQIERLNKIRRERNNTRVEASLSELRKVAETKASGRRLNIVPAMLEAVRADATIGEIFGVLREVYGDHTLPGVF